jgi:hypothetical protein
LHERHRAGALAGEDARATTARCGSENERRERKKNNLPGGASSGENRTANCCGKSEPGPDLAERDRATAARFAGELNQKERRRCGFGRSTNTGGDASPRKTRIGRRHEQRTKKPRATRRHRTLTPEEKSCGGAHANLANGEENRKSVGRSGRKSHTGRASRTSERQMNRGANTEAKTKKTPGKLNREVNNSRRTQT